MTWTEYWNDKAAVYVSDRHKQVHYAKVARELITLLPRLNPRVVDYGCGEALSADLVAEPCEHLYLCDSAPSVRERLRERHAGRPDVSIIAPLQFEQLPDESIDLIVINSVIQYLSVLELQRLLAVARRKLRPTGALLLADIIPPSVGAVTDAAALLGFARTNGFLLSASIGLVRLLFSKYRHTRGKLGLLRFEEPEIMQLLERSGFEARRHFPNLGHNQRRMALMATSLNGWPPARASAPSSQHRPLEITGSTTAA